VHGVCYVPATEEADMLARQFTFIDGREVEAPSAVAFFERLRETEHLPPQDLGRYLDLIRSRGALIFGVDLDVGTKGADIRIRCQRALGSLIRHGWVRLRGDDRKRLA
jgi:hypothetical protein